MKKSNPKFTVISLIIIGVIAFVVWVVENAATNDAASAPDTTQTQQ